jgi:hypothetical protein
MEKVFPEMVKVPVLMFEKTGRSLRGVLKVIPDANLPVCLFLDDNSVLLARE